MDEKVREEIQKIIWEVASVRDSCEFGLNGCLDRLNKLLDPPKPKPVRVVLSRCSVVEASTKTGELRCNNSALAKYDDFYVCAFHDAELRKEYGI